MNGTDLAAAEAVDDGGTSSHCSKDALTDMFGWFLQVLLASLAFTCLICEYFLLQLVHPLIIVNMFGLFSLRLLCSETIL